MSVITSRMASAKLLEDPPGFQSVFGLQHPEPVFLQGACHDLPEIRLVINEQYGSRHSGPRVLR